jgi:hypothetical protein
MNKELHETILEIVNGEQVHQQKNEEVEVDKKEAPTTLTEELVKVLK